MASLSNKSGKCSNFGNCSLADACTAIEVPSGVDFVCTECGKPLLLTDAGGKDGGSSKALVMGAVLVVVVLAIVGIGWSLLTRKPPPSSESTQVRHSVASQASSPEPFPAPPVQVSRPVSKVPPVPQDPEHKNCSKVDERTGLCYIAR